MKKIRTLILCLLAIGLASCQHAFSPSDEPDNPINVFDYLWNKLDRTAQRLDLSLQHLSHGLTADGQHPEYENGVPPDVHVLLDPALAAQGIDNIIETAAD